MLHGFLRHPAYVTAGPEPDANSKNSAYIKMPRNLVGQHGLGLYALLCSVVTPGNVSHVSLQQQVHS